MLRNRHDADGILKEILNINAKSASRAAFVKMGCLWMRFFKENILAARHERSEEAVRAGIVVLVLLENYDCAPFFVTEGFGAGVIKALAEIIFSFGSFADGGINEEAFHIFGLLVHTVGLDFLNEHKGMVDSKTETLHTRLFGFLNHNLLLLGRIAFRNISNRNRHTEMLLC